MEQDLFKYKRKPGKEEYEVTLANSEDLIGTIKYGSDRQEWTFITSYWISAPEMKEIIEVMEWLS